MCARTRARACAWWGRGSRFAATVMLSMIVMMPVLCGVTVRLDVQVRGTGGSLAMVIVVPNVRQHVAARFLSEPVNVRKNESQILCIPV